MIERIQLLLKAKGLSPSQLADEIHVKRSNVSHVLTGRNNPSLDFVSRLLSSYPDINPTWMILGKGAMLNTENNDEEGKTNLSASDNEAYESEGPPLSPDLSIAKSEEAPNYQVRKPGAGKKTQKIVVLYTDGTFSEFIPS